MACGGLDKAARSTTTDVPAKTRNKNVYNLFVINEI
jgi:hypothetical protein